MTLEMKGIYKSFGANDVLRDVSFTLNGGEICALLGENGAGKSTLMNILGGVHHADQGQILLDGTRVAFQTPAASLKHGIAFIHQELNLVNDLAIYENMFIGHELRKKNRFLDSAAMIAKTNEVFKKMDLDLDPRIMVRDLDASYKQIVEIARALLMEASIIIMDEPTTSLTEPEIRRVFDMMNTLRKSGVGIVFISHKLREVMEICTRYTVLRDGNMVSSGLVSETSIAHFWMMGLNPEKKGVYSAEDVRYSRSFVTASERTQANIAVGKQRLQEMGFFGTLKQLAQKMLTLYNDGTFAWGKEGNFLQTVFDPPNTKAAPFLRSIYYPDGSRYLYFTTFEQFIWLMILLLGAAGLFSSFSHKHAKTLNILWLTWIGLTVFELLFEVRARYLYTNVPLFCVLAAVGIENIRRLFCRITEKLSARLPAKKSV